MQLEVSVCPFLQVYVSSSRGCDWSDIVSDIYDFMCSKDRGRL